MFEHFDESHHPKRSVWAQVAVGVSVIAHISVACGLLIGAAWRLNKLALDDRAVGIASFGLPSAAPPPAAAHSSIKFKKKRLTQVHEVAQPDDKPRPDTKNSSSTNSSDNPINGDGASNGIPNSPGGVFGGQGGPLCIGSNCQPPPSPSSPAKKETETPPSVIPQELLKGHLLSGETQIHPSQTLQLTIAREGKTKLTGVIKACISANGTVTQASVIKSTGHPGYDHKLVANVRRWRYRPYSVDGKAIPVCTAIRFIYKLNTM